jgi:branched-subunit amino acid aminotransferase/4-amino-4-deoxychorismate lyase
VFVWLNGHVVAAARARISALDRGLLHGDGVYDTWRTYGGVPFAVAAHLRRLAAAARVLGLAPPGPSAPWDRRVRVLLARNRMADATCRLTITRGAAGELLVPTLPAPPTLLLTLRALPPDLARQQATGVHAILLPFPRDAAPPWSAHKTIGHPSAVLGRLLATRRRAAEGLYVTAAGEVTEGTTTNLMIVERGRLVTPPVEAGVLPGVTRSLVLALARRAGIQTREERITRVRLGAADEVLLTASTVEVLPVVRLDGRPVGGRRPGPVVRALQAAYTAHVARAARRPRR